MRGFVAPVVRNSWCGADPPPLLEPISSSLISKYRPQRCWLRTERNKLSSKAPVAKALHPEATARVHALALVAAVAVGFRMAEPDEKGRIHEVTARWHRKHAVRGVSANEKGAQKRFVLAGRHQER